jgi:thiamine pyrophosphokinase
VTPTLYRAAGPVTLVGAGPVRREQLAEALALAPEALAADGGADLELPEGHGFRAVIGDMDSIAGAAALRAAGVPVHRIDEQESTDLGKCLYSVEAPLFLGLGFLGGRIDHHLAALNALARYPEKAVVLAGGEDVCFLCPPALELDLPPGTRVSLFPMAPARGLVSAGLRWPVAGLELTPDGRIGTSNLALGGPVRIGFDALKVLVILPQEQLRQVATVLGP